MAIPKPEPSDWLKASAAELKRGDREVIKLLQEAYRNVNRLLKDLPDQPDAAFGNLIYRAQLERTRQALLEEQSRLFRKVGDVSAARRLASASRAAKLSAAADAALLSLVGEDDMAQQLYDGAKVTAQRTVETMLARMGLSAVPLSERIYRTSAWMNGRLDRLINSTMAAGLNAKRFAKVAREWFSPSVPGGTRYAAMRLARTEINNAFHATSVSYAAGKPWVSQMEWHLSKSHPEKDKCDLYAAASPYDVHEVPRKPHPQCMCYVTEVTPDEDDWIDAFVAGEYDDHLDAELAKTKAPTEAASAVGTPVKVQSLPDNAAQGETTDPQALSGEAAHAAVPKGLYKRGSLTTAQRKALKEWESGWFSVINHFLRSGSVIQERADNDTAETVAMLDTAYAQSLLPEPIQTWRGMYGARQLFGDRMDRDLTGFAWQELGYSSTTTVEGVVNMFNLTEQQNKRLKDQNVKIKVTVDAGVGALQVSTSKAGSDENGPQAEISLQRGVQWSITADRGVDRNGVRQLEARVSLARSGADRQGADAGEAGRELSGAHPQGAGQPQRTSPEEYAERVAFAAKKGDALLTAHYGLDRKLGAKGYNQMTQEMRSGVNQYTGAYYRQINAFLRSGTPIEPDMREWLTGIDAAMAGPKTSRDAVTYRGMHTSRLIFGDRLDNDMTGLEWHEDAFVSTTTVEGRTRTFLAGSGARDRVLLRILVPEGSSAVEASNLSAEAELLINRGSDFRVVKDNGYNSEGIRLLDVELLPSR